MAPWIWASEYHVGWPAPVSLKHEPEAGGFFMTVHWIIREANIRCRTLARSSPPPHAEFAVDFEGRRAGSGSIWADNFRGADRSSPGEVPMKVTNGPRASTVLNSTVVLRVDLCHVT